LDEGSRNKIPNPLPIPLQLNLRALISLSTENQQASWQSNLRSLYSAAGPLTIGALLRISLMEAGVDIKIRETDVSPLPFGQDAFMEAIKKYLDMLPGFDEVPR